MFSLDTCSHSGCGKVAVTVFDDNGEIVPDSLVKGDHYCIDHIADKQEFSARVIDYIKNHDKIVGLCAPNIHIADLDFTGKKFYGCNFQQCIFSNIHSENFRSRISSFDFAVFSDCNLIKSNFQFTSFAGAAFSHVLFTDSDLIHNNFCGIKSVQSSFDDSDLYNSRFIRAELSDTSFRNCNIKKANFLEIKRENVSFNLSNTREAMFSLDIESDEARKKADSSNAAKPE
ncbi:MAG: pentapeptide repeat-containing protein [Treponemataceae bacterium]|nr:pentapeptide repeat-containing protein [Treponemataceae bacterium]